MGKEIKIEDNLLIRIEDKTIVLTQGRTYISVATGIFGLIFSIIVLCVSISKANYLILLFIAPLLLISLFLLGFYQKIEINRQDKMLEKRYSLFNILSLKYKKRPFYKNIFVIEQIEQEEGEPKIKLFILGELYPIFLFNFNSMKTADNFKWIVEQQLKEYKLKMI